MRGFNTFRQPADAATFSSARPSRWALCSSHNQKKFRPRDALQSARDVTKPRLRPLPLAERRVGAVRFNKKRRTFEMHVDGQLIASEPGIAVAAAIDNACLMQLPLAYVAQAAGPACNNPRRLGTTTDRPFLSLLSQPATNAAAAKSTCGFSPRVLPPGTLARRPAEDQIIERTAGDTRARRQMSGDRLRRRADHDQAQIGQYIQAFERCLHEDPVLGKDHYYQLPTLHSGVF
jgi:hypothetical protein